MAYLNGKKEISGGRNLCLRNILFSLIIICFCVHAMPW